jgi:DNA-binding NtrC family response regulator
LFISRFLFNVECLNLYKANLCFRSLFGEASGVQTINFSCGTYFAEPDITMGQINGISVLKKAKELNPEIMVITTTACSDVACIIKALRLNANDYILKPFKLDDLLYRVSLFFEKSFSLGFHHTRHIKIA